MAMPIKQALVIGNDAYLSHPLGACINDAREVSNSLRSIGFQVHAQVDADYRSMQAISRRFIRSIQPGAIVLFYFSGHGCQYDGYNFLMPTDSVEPSIDNLEIIKASAMSAERLIQDMHSRRPRVVIVILDSCRSYIGPGSMLQTARADAAGHRLRPGLAPMRVSAATIVSYSCAAEESSSAKSRNGKNSLYTYHLLRYITTPNVDIDSVLRSVAYEVQRDPLNEERQVPYRYSSCNEYICLASDQNKNVSGHQHVMHPGAFLCKSFSKSIDTLILEMRLAPFKKSLPRMHSNRNFQPPIDHHRNRMNNQSYKQKHHHSTNVSAPSKMMRYPTDPGYSSTPPFSHRRS
jgi:uncharacterized caspase-like protein